jgi:hypothetical protein
MSRTLDLSDTEIEEAVAELSDQLAREAGAFAEVFQSWRRPEVARSVVESLLNGDAETFKALLQPGLDAFDPDPSDREAIGIALCYKLLLLVEKIGQMKRIPSNTETCRLRTDLTADERRRYVAIAARFTDAEVWEVGVGRGLTAVGEDGPVVPPGPFLDALRAEGLLNCKQDETILALDPNTGVYGQARDVCGFQL